MRPLVTVLMPNHNGEAFIAQTIESVLGQTFRDFEFLIVEDGSTDRSREIIGRYADLRIRMVQLERNGHICNALNVGLEKARGKYIARIDSDDCWYQEKLALQVEFMEGHPECGGCFTWVNVVDENNGPVSDSLFNTHFRVENCSRHEWVRRFYFEGCRLCHPSAVIPRKIFEELGRYDLGYVQIQDFDMWSRIVKHYPIHVITTPLMNYRYVKNGSNVSAQSKTVDQRSLLEFSMVLSRYFDDLSDEEFVSCFHQDFIRPDASTQEELACERALLLLRPTFCGQIATRMGALQKLHAILNNDAERKVLAEEYGIDQMIFYRLTAESVFSREVSLKDYGRKDMVKEILRRTMQRGFRKEDV